jgi:hypothetical protein
MKASLNQENVEVRDSPSNAGTVVRTFTDGHRFNIIRVVQNEDGPWCEVSCHCGQGYVPGRVQVFYDRLRTFKLWALAVSSVFLVGAGLNLIRVIHDFGSNAAAAFLATLCLLAGPTMAFFAGRVLLDRYRFRDAANPRSPAHSNTPTTPQPEQPASK